MVWTIFNGDLISSCAARITELFTRKIELQTIRKMPAAAIISIFLFVFFSFSILHKSIGWLSES